VKKESRLAFGCQKIIANYRTYCVGSLWEVKIQIRSRVQVSVSLQSFFYHKTLRW